jgi:hypothetical protein
MMRRSLVLALVTLAAIDLAAQTTTIGRLYPQGGVGAFGGNVAPLSFVDFMHPATRNGALRRAVVRWANAPATPCANAYKLKFLRPSANAYFIVAERGPFPGNNGRNEFDLSPEVVVQAGDVIGITQLDTPAQCGNVVMSMLQEVAMQSGNFEVSTNSILGTVSGVSPAIFAATAENVVVTVLPVAGATRGSFGSLFKTAVQLTGTDSTPVSGTLVYHPAGQIGSPSDPSINFTLAQRQTLSFPDLVTTLGRSGLGSVDIVTAGMSPVVTARVFNDAGSATGTSGFTEDAFAPQAALRKGQTAYLPLASDFSSFRVNIGIRTLDVATTISVGRYSSSGTLLAGPNLVLEYGPNFFEQKSLADFAGSVTQVNDGVLTIEVLDGAAYVYATITDNRTNDSSIVFAVPTR